MKNSIVKTTIKRDTDYSFWETTYRSDDKIFERKLEKRFV